jgi:WD40 repeat protein
MMSPKMRIHDLLSCFCIFLLLTACSGQDAAPPPAAVTAAPSDAAAQSDAAPEPKIIVQLGHQAPVIAVRWVDGGRHLASLGRDGSVVFWNAASGAILDHAQIPLDPLPQVGQQQNPMRFHAFTDGPVAGTLAVAYVGKDAGVAEQACPGAHHAGKPWCTYVIDLATRVVRADAGVPIPAGEVRHWPISPDGKLRPEPNHGNARRGLPNTGDEHFGDLDPTCTSVQRCRYGVTLFVHDANAIHEPKTIAQLVGHRSPVLAAYWNSTGRALTSLASDGSIVSWDVGQAIASEQAQVPLDTRLLLPEGGNEPLLRLHAFTTAFDGRLMVAYAAANDAVAERACPGANPPGTPWCTYVIETWPFAVLADADLSIPAGESPLWPVSPDARLYPKASRGDLPNTGGGHSGKLCTPVQPCHYGVTVSATGGNTVSRALTGDTRNYFLDADVSPEGLRLLRVVDSYDPESGRITRVETLGLDSGNREPVFQTPRDYHHARWLDEKRYFLGSNGYSASNDTEDAMAGFPPARLIDAGCAARGDCTAIESRWQTRTTDAGGLVALGSLEHLCFKGPGRHGADNVLCIGDSVDAGDGETSTGPPATGLAFRAADARDWRALVVPALADQRITAIETSSDGLQLAVATSAWVRADSPEAGEVLRLWLLDIPEGAVTAQRRLLEIVDPIAGDTIRALSFSADGRRIVFTLNAEAQTGEPNTGLYVVDTDAAAKVRTWPGFSQRVVAIGNDRVLGLDDGALLDLDTGGIIVHIPFRTAAVRAGWIERSRLMWTSTEDGQILFWDSGDGTLVLTLYALPDNRYFALAPGGRYDTNLSADTQLVRWLVPDAPWQSLAAQTFMRDYYEPGLYRRLLDCRASDTCATAFKPLPAIASLNRVLPEVRITGVRAGRDAAEAVVAVEVREGVDADAPNGKSRSGLYNPRLFRNGRLVAMKPRQPDAAGSDLAQWRQRNAVQAAGGVHQLEFTVPVPTQVGEELQEFSAYAFNEDRIKGETDTLQWTRDPIAPRPRRAYVLAIGIDDYDTPRFRLNYAVADARLMASRLSDIPGYETHSLVLAAERGADGRRTRVDRATLARVLSLLAGDADREATLAALRADGIDASMLQPATPDDAVIVSFSGHGWANPSGDFYLIPGDGRWPEGSEAPDLSTVFATADLVAPFQLMHANEITLVIDACHSAASVADGRFKPGPMGDSGLGQLAYDKGIRILAATQADDVALEDARLGQGLLTYALAVDGLGGGQADLDADGSIRTDEWLAYAVQRLPGLANDARVGRIGAAGEGSRAITFSDLPAEAPARRVQQPALFDFNPKASTLVLREETP